MHPPTGGKKRVSLTVNVGKEGGRKLTPSSSLPTNVDKKKISKRRFSEVK